VIDAIDNPKEATPGDSSSLTKKEIVLVRKTQVKSSDGIRLTQAGTSVAFSLPEPAYWNIYDMNGHKIASAYGNEFLWKNASKGVYTVTAQNGTVRHARKIALK